MPTPDATAPAYPQRPVNPEAVAAAFFPANRNHRCHARSRAGNFFLQAGIHRAFEKRLGCPGHQRVQAQGTHLLRHLNDFVVPSLVRGAVRSYPILSHALKAILSEELDDLTPQLLLQTRPTTGDEELRREEARPRIRRQPPRSR